MKEGVFTAMENESKCFLDGDSMDSAENIIMRIESLALSCLRNLSDDKAKEITQQPNKWKQEKSSSSQFSGTDKDCAFGAGCPEFLQTLTHTSISRTASVLAIMLSVLSMHAEGRYVTLRQLYYSSINIVPRQRAVDRDVAALTQLLQVPREALRITCTAKCIIRGPIIIKEKTSTLLLPLCPLVLRPIESCRCGVD